MSSKIEWREVTPSSYIGKSSNGSESICYCIYLRETDGGASYYALDQVHINAIKDEFGRHHIANFRSLENAKLFAEIMHIKESVMVEDVVDSLQWLTNAEVNK